MPMLSPPLPPFSLLTETLPAQFPQHRGTLALSRLVETEEYLRDFRSPLVKTMALSDLELAKLAAFKLPKRQRQWLTGRLCAKNAAIGYCREHLPHFLVPAACRIRIETSPSGRPAFPYDIPELQDLDISISHSDDYAIACVASGLCGIDIQKESKKLLRVRERFCQDTEVEILQQHLPNLDNCQQLTLLWTAKEAAKKALSRNKMPEFLALTLTSCIPLREGLFSLSLQWINRPSATPALDVSVLATRFNDYAISLTLIERDKNYA